MKTLFLAAGAALLMPVAAFAQDAAAPAAEPAMAAPAAAMPALPKCTAKVQDSCDQSTTSEKNALPYYPAETRDAGNNKIRMAAGGRKRAAAVPAAAAPESMPPQ